MLFSELVFVLLLVAVLVLTAFVGFMVAGMNRRTEAQGAELARMRAQLAAGDQAQDSAVLGVLDRLGHAQAQLAGQIEREVERRAREVSQYIDPATTAPFALAVVPDGAYATCRGAFAEAHRRHVIIVGYSMALPYLLAVYQMHLQFARSVDMENLQACLMDVDSQLDGLDGILENKLQRALTMLGNTYQEGRQGVARIRASVQSIQAAERMEALPSLSVLEEGDRPEASPEVVEDDRLHDNGLEDRRPPLGALRRG